jgi:hypothetical protein
MKLETAIMAAWLILAAAHVLPALPVMAPWMVGRLYGVSPSGDVGLLLRHRALLFAIVCALCAWAAFDASVRPAAYLAAGVSVIGFLPLYALAGFPKGALRTVAIVDGAVLPALALAGWALVSR